MGQNVETGTRGSSAFEDDCACVLALLGDRTASGTVTNAKMCLRKSRAGATGQEFVPRPRIVQAGDDETTLVLDWLGGEAVAAGAAMAAKAKAESGWAKKSLRLLRQALMGMVADVGKDMKPWVDEQTVRAVDLEVVRGQFYKIHPAADAADAAEQAPERAGRRSGRAIDDAQTGNLIGMRDLEGVIYVWLIAPGAQAEMPL